VNEDQHSDEEHTSHGRPPGVFDEAFLTGIEGVTELLLIRHAQQHIDVYGVAADWVDPPLTEHGEAQARLLAQGLSTTHIDAIFASPLKRTQGTALPLAGVHRLPIQTVDDLREVEVFREVPPDVTVRDYLGEDLLNAVRRRMIDERNWDVYPHSERSYDFKNRVVNAIESIIAKSAGDRVAIVCHGGVINAFCGHIIGSRYDMFFRPAHSSVSVVAVGGNRRVVRSLNDIHHLQTAEGDFLTY
jgi:broad specificity phosphatase PhoE